MLVARSVIGSIAPEIVRTVQSPYASGADARGNFIFCIGALAVLRPIARPAFPDQFMSEVDALHRACRHNTSVAIRSLRNTCHGMCAYNVCERQ